MFEEYPHDTIVARHVVAANKRNVWRILRTPLIIASFIDRIFAVETAWAFNLVIEYSLVEYAEISTFVALERNVAENGPSGHVLAIAHGAFARGVEVVEILTV